MAKLSARGRSEVMRFRLVMDAEVGTVTLQEAYMSDGTILNKRSTLNRHDSRYDAGDWRVFQKKSPKFRSWDVESITDLMESKGYTKIKG